MKGDDVVSWADLDAAVAASAGEGRTVVLSNTVLSPSK